MIPFLYRGFFIYPPFLFTCLYCPLLLITIMPPFLSLIAIGCSKVLSFTLSWSLLFFLFVIFHSTRRHLETTSLLHTFKVEKGFKVQFIPKVVKSLLRTLIINDYLPLYIQLMPQTYLLYTYHNFTNVKMPRFKSFNCPRLCCLHFMFRMSN